MSTLAPKLALSADFLEAFSKLPKQQQKKTRQLIDKFRADPTQHSLNFEPIAGMADDKVRTLRVDQAWRAVVIQPPRGDVYVMVWVDHHDEAMAWAKNKKFEVNARTGSFHVYELIDGPIPAEGKMPAEEAPPAAPASLTEVGADAIPAGRLFSGHTDDQLLMLGVPEALLAAVRALRTEPQLMALAEYLPDEAQNGLFGLYDGMSFEDALESGGRKAPTPAVKPEPAVDVENFEAAFEQPWTKQKFALVEDDDSLEAVLGASLDRWRVFLHPSQRKLVEIEAKGSMRVLGGPGTGKTVVAMHRARHLARKLAAMDSDGKVLFTTFTKNLATDIERNLKNLCGPEISRIEVVNLNRWASSFLKSQGERFNIAQKDLWPELGADGEHGFSLAFYRDEWSHVVQANDVTDEHGYLQARRTGRGTRLSRRQRKAVWEVMARYRALLDRRGRVEHADIIRRARLTLEGKNAEGDDVPKKAPVANYRHILVDEAQDLRAADLRLLRAIVPEGPADIFLVGDAHQRIYGHKVSLGDVGVNIKGLRSRRLKINYRTTEQIRDWAVALMKGVDVDDLDEGKDTLKGYRSLRKGLRPRIAHFATPQQEADAIVAQIRAWLGRDGVKPEEICLAARTNAAITERYADILRAAGIAHAVVSANAEQFDDGVRLATMHRVKGLEFRFVIIASVQDGMVPLRFKSDDHADEVARRAHEDAERSLLFVAATRARDELFITGYGNPCPWL